MNLSNLALLICLGLLPWASLGAQDAGSATFGCPEKQALPSGAAADRSAAAIRAMRDSACRVSFEAEGRILMGWIYRPPGNGPFPAVLWNHGSEKNPVRHPELAQFYVSHGYVFFLPVRHGHGESPGEYIRD